VLREGNYWLSLLFCLAVVLVVCIYVCKKKGGKKIIMFLYAYVYVCMCVYICMYTYIGVARRQLLALSSVLFGCGFGSGLWQERGADVVF